MDKKFIIQIMIVFITITLLFVFFLFYFSKINNTNQTSKVEEKQTIMSKTNENIIKDIKYFAKNKNGDSYIIFSDYGKINLDNVDLTYMINVTAIVTLKNSEKITITSNFANFNHKSYETEFFEKVLIARNNEKITSEKLKFSLEENLVLLSKDVIFNKPGFNMKADKVEIDLITKNSKIVMNDIKKKVITVGESK